MTGGYFAFLGREIIFSRQKNKNGVSRCLNCYLAMLQLFVTLSFPPAGIEEKLFLLCREAVISVAADFVKDGINLLLVGILSGIVIHVAPFLGIDVVSSTGRDLHLGSSRDGEKSHDAVVEMTEGEGDVATPLFE